MLQSWVAEKMAEQRRQDLRQLSRPVRESGRTRAGAAEVASPLPRLSVVAAPDGGRPLSRPVGQHVGQWLIRAGTRLGGATAQAS
jgi:hypothetical protein